MGGLGDRRRRDSAEDDDRREKRVMAWIIRRRRAEHWAGRRRLERDETGRCARIDKGRPKVLCTGAMARKLLLAEHRPAAGCRWLVLVLILAIDDDGGGGHGTIDPCRGRKRRWARIARAAEHERRRRRQRDPSRRSLGRRRACGRRRRGRHAVPGSAGGQVDAAAESKLERPSDRLSLAPDGI
jgi:hypothetical protein